MFAITLHIDKWQKACWSFNRSKLKSPSMVILTCLIPGSDDISWLKVVSYLWLVSSFGLLPVETTWYSFIVHIAFSNFFCVWYNNNADSGPFHNKKVSVYAMNQFSKVARSKTHTNTATWLQVEGQQHITCSRVGLPLKEAQIQNWTDIRRHIFVGMSIV